jgi:hypothetical protein
MKPACLNARIGYREPPSADTFIASTHAMRAMTSAILRRFSLVLTLSFSANAFADCNLAFAPEEIRQRARQHHHESSRRNAPTTAAAHAEADPAHADPPYELPLAGRTPRAAHKTQPTTDTGSTGH